MTKKSFHDKIKEMERFLYERKKYKWKKNIKTITRKL